MRGPIRFPPWLTHRPSLSSQTTRPEAPSFAHSHDSRVIATFRSPLMNVIVFQSGVTSSCAPSASATARNGTYQNRTPSRNLIIRITCANFVDKFNIRR